MLQTKIIGIKDLKNNLSAYLKELKREHRFLITDRDRIVAELREPTEQLNTSQAISRREEWVRQGQLRFIPCSAKVNYGDFDSLLVSLPPGTARKIIDEGRSE